MLELIKNRVIKMIKKIRANEKPSESYLNQFLIPVKYCFTLEAWLSLIGSVLPLLIILWILKFFNIHF